MRPWRRRKETLGVFSLYAKRYKSVYNSVNNNNTNLNLFNILSNYIIWNRLSKKTISRYCPFKHTYDHKQNQLMVFLKTLLVLNSVCYSVLHCFCLPHMQCMELFVQFHPVIVSSKPIVTTCFCELQSLLPDIFETLSGLAVLLRQNSCLVQLKQGIKFHLKILS